MYPGPGVPRLHGVEGGLVEAVLRRPPLAGEVQLGVLATLPLLDRALDGKGELDLLRQGEKRFFGNSIYAVFPYKKLRLGKGTHCGASVRKSLGV